MKCKECGAEMETGYALSGSFRRSGFSYEGILPDAPSHELIDCYKCPKCGHSEEIR